jgi:hypothetical protein
MPSPLHGTLSASAPLDGMPPSMVRIHGMPVVSAYPATVLVASRSIPSWHPFIHPWYAYTPHGIPSPLHWHAFSTDVLAPP